MLYSMRPPQGSPDWGAIERRSPNVVYVAPGEVVIPTPHNTTTAPAITLPAIGSTPDNHADPITMEHTPAAPSGGGESQDRPRLK